MKKKRDKKLPVERMQLVIASARPTFSSFFGLAEKMG